MLTNRRRNESGLALLDVLLGMAIFALIAVIAVQSMGMFRQRAYVTTVVSDAHQLGVTLEANRIGKASYQSTVPPTPEGANLTTGVSVGAYTVSSDGETFSVCAQHSQGAWAVYESRVGAVRDSGRSGGCAADTGPSGPSSPTATPTAAPADFTGYPPAAGGYETGTAADAGMQCPGLLGVESQWAGIQEQYKFFVTFAESDVEFRARTGKQYADQKFRLINAGTGAVGAWEGSTSWTTSNRQKSGLITSGVSEGSIFYIEVSSRNYTGGGASGKCQPVGKVTLRKSPNYSPGTVQTLDGSAVPSGFTPRPTTVPCPEISNPTYVRTFSSDDVNFTVANVGTYNLLWRAKTGPYGAGYMVVSGTGTARTIGNSPSSWAAGEERTFDLLFRNGTGFESPRSDYCMRSISVTKPNPLPARDVVIPQATIAVPAYW